MRSTAPAASPAQGIPAPNTGGSLALLKRFEIRSAARLAVCWLFGSHSEA